MNAGGTPALPAENQRAVARAACRSWKIACALGCACLGFGNSGGRLTAADPSFILIQSAPGRFEIAAIDPSLAHGVSAMAEEAWRVLSGPLGLPTGFSSPIFVRAVPPDSGGAGDPAPFRVTVEVGGIVSVRLRADLATPGVVRRALVQGVLMRLAVAQHGATTTVTSPLWLEQACVGWWLTRSDAAQLDALKQESARLAPSAIASLLNGRHGAAETRADAVGATWLMIFLQAEAARSGEWPEFVRRLLAGDDPAAALAGSFPGRFGDPEDRELWWQTGYHHVRRARALPGLDAAESREQLGALARFVFADDTGAADRIVVLGDVVARAQEPVVAVELTRRAAVIEKLTPLLHPFYRNAGLALGEVLSARVGPTAQRATKAAAYEQDWRDAVELEAATAAALDRLERR